MVAFVPMRRYRDETELQVGDGHGESRTLEEPRHGRPVRRAAAVLARLRWRRAKAAIIGPPGVNAHDREVRPAPVSMRQRDLTRVLRCLRAGRGLRG